MVSTDWELVALYVAGNDKAFEELVRRWSPRLRPQLARMLRQLEPDVRHALVEDLLQDVWIRIAKHARNGNPEKKFSTWLFTISANLARNEHRNRKKKAVRMPLLRNPDSGTMDEYEPVAPPSKFQPDLLIESKDLLEQLFEWLSDNTSDDNATALLMREVEGMSYAEMAERLGVPEGTVKSRLHRGREVARRYLKSQGR
jgi:RNA polymerase sigma-70 factor, ECF subfamily